MRQNPGSKTRQVLEGAGDAVANQALESAFEAAFDALGQALACAAEVAVQCGAIAVEAACQVAGSALDGIG